MCTFLLLKVNAKPWIRGQSPSELLENVDGARLSLAKAGIDYVTGKEHIDFVCAIVAHEGFCSNNKGEAVALTKDFV